jgi:hypothetical protein
MTWNRSIAAPALAQTFENAVAAASETITVFDRPPMTVNPPAIVIGWPSEVRYANAAPGIDEATLPVLCVGALDGEDRVAEIINLVRNAATDTQLGGAVQIAYPAIERNWRQVNVAGADLLQAEVTFTIQM